MKELLPSIIEPVLTVVFGLALWWIKSIHSDIKKLTIDFARFEGRLETIKERTDPIPKLQQDVTQFHEFKRSIEREKRIEQ